jgi:hypothetical protein
VGFFQRLALSPDGELLAVAGAKHIDGKRELRLLHLASGQEVGTAGPAPWPRRFIALSFSPDGRLLAAGLEKGVRLWEVRRGK